MINILTRTILFGIFAYYYSILEQLMIYFLFPFLTCYLYNNLKKDENQIFFCSIFSTIFLKSKSIVRNIEVKRIQSLIM